MRTITIHDSGEGVVPDMTREFGTNDRDGGVFCRLADGTWQQWRGNSQTPTFRTPDQFRRYLRTRCDVTGRTIARSGWVPPATSAAARALGSARTPAKAAAVRENGKKGGRPPATVHVTRVTNGDVYGHAARHCDPTGCAGDERYLGRIEDAEVGHVYEIRGGRVLAEIVE